jgi:hypothetical protein
MIIDTEAMIIDTQSVRITPRRQEETMKKSSRGDAEAQRDGADVSF